ncbi:type I restriction-modification system subunit M [Clostridium butyricum]|uniref:site-specific DNA-methyltransferase (adenine-specific) n=1 Tax=Clostridium butyricum TaxID=1492 RepID=A0AAD0LG65_CLOBU|nr:type I restriction-modification system subunit M [Clostridium butyricum]AXB85036.1 type I restriction-modification system subunit M [Clostridium butyricum]
MNKTTSQDVIKVVWKACDTFRGTMDCSKYKDYILTMLFVKYVSDFYKEKLEELKAKFGDNEDRIQKSLKREKFQLDSECTFDVIYENRNAENIGEIINKILMKIEDDNKEKLEGIFRNIDFNSEAELGRTKERNAALKHLIEDFADDSLDLRPSMLNGDDVIGDAYEFLIANFASDAGKKGGEFYTPGEVSTLLAKLVAPKDGDRIYDPTCGSGSLLIKASKEVGTDNFRLYGQERNGQTQALAKMNMFLHEINDSVIEWGDTLRNPLHLENERLMKFDAIVSNPPFSLDKWGAEDLKDDIYNRFEMGLPPKSKGDYAFIEHMLASLNENGTAGIILPHGVLFRAASEGKIRKQIIEHNWLDAVIGLPENLFFGTGIPACILIFKKNKIDKNIVFIDASREYDKVTNQNIIRNEYIKKIVKCYNDRQEIDKYCHIANPDEIKDNNFNLNIPRYIDTFEEEDIVDIRNVENDIKYIEEELSKVRSILKQHLKEIDFI